MYNGSILIRDLYLDHILVNAYPALNIFELGENLKTKTICLASVSAPAIHVVPKSQDQPQHLSHTVSLQ